MDIRYIRQLISCGFRSPIKDKIHWAHKDYLHSLKEKKLNMLTIYCMYA